MRLLRGISTVMFLRLCSRAPRRVRGGTPLRGAGAMLGGGGKGGGGGGGGVFPKTGARKGEGPPAGGGGKPRWGGRDLGGLPGGGGREPYLAWLASEVGGG